jgi:hypothetical protein
VNALTWGTPPTVPGAPTLTAPPATPTVAFGGRRVAIVTGGGGCDGGGGGGFGGGFGGGGEAVPIW